MRWIKKVIPDQKIINHLIEVLQVDENIAILLAQRNITNFDQAKAFFRPTLQDLHDPFLMKDMNKAIDRIESAIKNNERILILGDYDVDGTTAVSLVYSFFKQYTQNIATYIPDRYTEGYGISFQSIDFANDNDFSLIIALDCGIKSIDKINYAKQFGIDFIIGDHHLPGDDVPEAIAVLDPKQKDCSYPYKELCGCGIGFKIIQAYTIKNNLPTDDLIQYLDLVAIAIGADIVPMTGENRILTKFGLEVINNHPRTGVKALIHNVKKKELTITDVVFIIAPRINAAGRIKHGSYAVELLTETTWEEALDYAKQIEDFNTDRRSLDDSIAKEAKQLIIDSNEEDNYSTVVFQPHWHKGVIGIVASRLIETYYRPTVVFTENDGKYVASARSIKNFDLYEALEKCQDHLIQFGGHKAAAGMTLDPKEYQNFKNKFEEVIQSSLTKEDLQPEIEIDLEIDFKNITPKFLRILKQFEPLGPENLAPIFLTKKVIDTGYGKSIGQEDKHLKLFVKQDNSEGFNTIGFNLANKIDFVKNCKPFDLVYSIEENIWNNEVSVQLKARDIKA